MKLATTQETVGARVKVGARTGVRKELWLALLYMAPALLLFLAFTYVPFFRSIWLSLNVTDPTGEISRFNGIDYYARVLSLDGSGRSEYLKSVVPTVCFSLMVVPAGVVVAVALAVMGGAR